MSGSKSRSLSFYHYGATTMFASRSDQRFGYCLYVPSDYEDDTDKPYPVVVLVHGTDRTAQGYRDHFVGFAETHRAIVLAPLFPAGVAEVGDLDGYKFIEFRGIRYDGALLAILDEIADLYRVDVDRVLMHGFSGGAHFAHRFLYLHPERLLGVSIAAPGVVTLLDESRPWWTGTADIETLFGRTLDLDAIRLVAVQTVIGEEDTETWEITITPDSPLWMEGANDAGTTRIDRIRALRTSLELSGIDVRHDIVPSTAHEGYALLPPVKEFLADTLQRSRLHPER